MRPKWQELRQRDLVSVSMMYTIFICSVLLHCHFVSCLTYTCSPRWQSFMTCDVDTEAEIEASVAITAAPPFLLDAQPLPPPFQCRAGTNPVGYWDEVTSRLYEDTTFFNSGGRSDVEGCCYWGRGVLLTRGTVSIVRMFVVSLFFPNCYLARLIFPLDFLVQLRKGEE